MASNIVFEGIDVSFEFNLYSLLIQLEKLFNRSTSKLKSIILLLTIHTSKYFLVLIES